MLSKSFKSGKCKTSLKLAASRIKLLKNKRDIQVKHLRRELAQLLATGQEQTARIRVEHVIREEKTLSAYDLIEIYCELIVARLPIIESQKSCPIDLKEAISSVIFASPRCADIPELVDARKQFVAKYGKDFATSALELRPGCGVNHMIVEKLSAKAPDTETKFKILTAIAKEHDVKWDSKAFEELQKPTDDLLNGSSSYTHANKTPMESLNDNFSPAASLNDASSKILRSEISSRPTSFNSNSYANMRASASPVHPTQNESMTSDKKASDLNPSQVTTSLNEQPWTMEFKDVVSAAQAAAFSAERASMAARAAAELAGQGNFSRENSNDQNGSSLHSSSRKEMPNRVPSSKMTGEHSESVNMDYDLVKGFLGVKKEPGNLLRDKLGRGVSHNSADNMKFSSQANTVEKTDGFQNSFSRKELEGRKEKHGEAKFAEETVDYDRSASASSIGALDDNTIWAPSIGKHQTGNTPEMGDYVQHTSSEYAAPMFDEYGPESDDYEGNLLDSFDNKRDEKPFSIAPNTNGVNSNFSSDSIPECHTITEEKVSSSKFDDYRSVTYDDSDGISLEDEDDMRSSLKDGTVQSSRLLHEERDSSQNVSSQEDLLPSSLPKAKPLMGGEKRDQLQLPSSIGTKDSGIAGGGGFDLKFGRLTGGLRNRGYNYPPYTASSVVDSSLSSKEMVGGTASSAEQTTPLEKTFTSPVTSDEDGLESSRKAPTNPESSKAKGSSLEEHAEINRSNKVFSQDKSVEDTSVSAINPFAYERGNNPGYKVGDPNPAKQDPHDSTTTKAFVSKGSEAVDQKIYVDKQRTNAYKKLSSRMSRSDFDSVVDEGERDSQINIGNRGNANDNSNIKLSRRTRGFLTKEKNNFPTSSEYSDTPNSESQSLSQAVGEEKVLRGTPNLNSRKPHLSAEQPVHEYSVERVNNKNIEGRRNQDATTTSSGNNKTSDSGGGTKLQGVESPKASHVHPKLPDYDTLAAHFQSLRSNLR